MAYAHVDLALGSGLNDGTSWANAYQGAVGLVSAAAAAASGDTIWVKNTVSTGTSTTIVGNETLAEFTNPILIIGVKSGTTNEGVNVVQSDLIPGLRTGQTTRAYAWGGGTVPSVTITGPADIIIRGSFYIYGLQFTSADDLTIASITGAAPVRVCLDECEFSVGGGGDNLGFGANDNTNAASHVYARHCRFDAAAGNFRFSGPNRSEFFDCEFDSTNSSGVFYGVEWTGHAKLYACDLTGAHANLVNVSDFHNSCLEFRNCRMPASHVLTLGTATHQYEVANYGSDDQTGLTSTNSEQQLEIDTREGTVDVETTAVRTNGADDGATGGFSWAVAVNNVTDNVVGVVTPWMHIWVDGDGTEQTLTVFIANDAAEAAANLIEDDEAFLEVAYPSEAGISMYDYRPNSEAPTGFGKMQLLGTAADLTTTSETWGSGANNDQKLTATIDPDYQGWVYCRVHYSKASGPTLYVDPKPEIS